MADTNSRDPPGYYHRLLSRLGPAEFFYHYNISFVHRYVYVEIPKCASTTVKSNLGRHAMLQAGLDAAEVETFFASPHGPAWGSPFIKPFQLTPRQFDQFVDRADVLRFVFVRNPFARAASGYIDKVLGGHKELDSLRPQIARMRGTDEAEIQGGDVTFVEFLRALSEVDDALKIDAHFRPQSFHASLDIIRYDVVARIESFDRDWSLIADRLGLGGVRFERSPHITDARMKLAQLYDDEATALVQQIYAQDFDVLGYSTRLSDATG